MTLSNVCKENKKLTDKIDKALATKEAKGNRKDLMVVSLVSIARQHYLSIFSLVKSANHYSSAFALLRPLVDASYRAIWLMKVATDLQVENIDEGKRQFHNTFKLAKSIDKEFDKESKAQNRFDIFYSRYNLNSPILHDMTHSGNELMARQLKDGKIYPSFEESDLLKLLEEAKKNYVLLLLIYSDFNENEDLMTTTSQLGDLNFIMSSTKK